MVVALRDQKIYRRGGMGKTKKLGPRQPHNNKRGHRRHHFLPILLVFTVILLLGSSIAFSLAMIDTRQNQLTLPDSSLNDQEFMRLLNITPTPVPLVD